jgi:tRNA G18 (ribose-2'-O)-methylase SpoU
VADPRVLRLIAGFPVHRGVLAALDRPAVPSIDDVLARTGSMLVLEDLTDHENIGALFRNAAAFGAAGVLLSPGCADPFYRRSVRVSMGHVLTVPFAQLGPWPDALNAVRASGRVVVALTPEPDAPPITATRAPVALLLGTEGAGLSAAALAQCDARARIPMTNGVDSLNVATAAAIALYTISGSRNG